MADKKISALTGATTPLAGTEVLPIVQGSATVKVSVANLTAGRAISATQLTLTTGNLIVSDGKGIDFSATAGTGTSELLNDYEEGTFTATFLSDGGSITTDATIRYGFYTKVGRQVTVICYVKASAISSPTGDVYIQGLPFTSASTTGQIASVSVLGNNFAATAITQLGGSIANSSSLITLTKFAAGSLSSVSADIQATSIVNVTATYFTAGL